MWREFGPRRPRLSPERRQVVQALLPEVLRDLHRARGGMRRLVVAPFINDTTGYVTEFLRERLEQTGLFDVADRSLAEKVRWKLNLSPGPAEPLDQQLARARRRGADAVLCGEVIALESLDGQSLCRLRVTLAGVADEGVRFEKIYETKQTAIFGGAAGLGEELPGLNPTQRLLGWALAVLLLPILTVTFIRQVLMRESNWANFCALAIYTTVDGLLAALLVGASFASLTAGLVFLGLLGLALLYNVTVMTQVLRTMA
ncbi:MAG: hypothetical protein D6766_07740 [Verrucomicrobia bacterium]|nr:MAG: hypothetical protein D6766_07740 [Verrucomicrobiota bacterium]